MPIPIRRYIASLLSRLSQGHQLQRLHGFLPPELIVKLNIHQYRRRQGWLLECHVLAATAQGDARRLLLSAARLDWRAISNCVGTEHAHMGSCLHASVVTPLHWPGACLQG